MDAVFKTNRKFLSYHHSKRTGSLEEKKRITIGPYLCHPLFLNFLQPDDSSHTLDINAILGRNLLEALALLDDVGPYLSPRVLGQDRVASEGRVEGEWLVLEATQVVWPTGGWTLERLADCLHPPPHASLVVVGGFGKRRRGREASRVLRRSQPQPASWPSQVGGNRLDAIEQRMAATYSSRHVCWLQVKEEEISAHEVETEFESGQALELFFPALEDKAPHQPMRVELIMLGSALFHFPRESLSVVRILSVGLHFVSNSNLQSRKSRQHSWLSLEHDQERAQGAYFVSFKCTFLSSVLNAIQS